MSTLNTPPSNNDDCCTPVIKQEIDDSTVNLSCPECATEGKSIDTQTVKSLLAVSLENIRPQEYRFCTNEDCPVVYFTMDGEQVIHENDLRERVYQKAAGDENVKVCYCFRVSPADMRIEFNETGSSTVVDRVKAGVKAGQCACKIRNPQGSCCLGNVRSVAKKMVSEAAPQVI